MLLVVYIDKDRGDARWFTPSCIKASHVEGSKREDQQRQIFKVYPGEKSSDWILRGI